MTIGERRIVERLPASSVFRCEVLVFFFDTYVLQSSCSHSCCLQVVDCKRWERMFVEFPKICSVQFTFQCLVH